MLANREGLFHAHPVDIGIGETSQNKLLQVVINYRLFEEMVDGQWSDCSGENLEISGYHVLEKKDHTLNTTTIDALKTALGWDGADPFWLQDNVQILSQQPVQLKLAVEEYEGQRSLKVKFLNPYGSRGGGVPKADDSMRRDVANRLGPKFRATAGGTSAPAPKPAGKPTAPKPAAPAAAPPTPTAPAEPPAATATADPPKPATMQEAWDEFCRHCPPPKWTQKDIEKEWFRILAGLFPGRQADQLTPADWGVMLAEGPQQVIPF